MVNKQLLMQNLMSQFIAMINYIQSQAKKVVSKNPQTYVEEYPDGCKKYIVNGVKKRFVAPNDFIRHYDNNGNFREISLNGKRRHMAIKRESKMNEQLHNNHEPARVWNDSYGNVLKEEYYVYGKLHREGFLPAIIEYDTNKNIIDEKYYLDDKEYSKKNYGIELFKRGKLSESEIITVMAGALGQKD